MQQRGPLKASTLGQRAGPSAAAAACSSLTPPPAGWSGTIPANQGGATSLPLEQPLQVLEFGLGGGQSRTGGHAAGTAGLEDQRQIGGFR